MNKEPITLHLETFNNEEYILADECIEAIGLHRRTNTELHQTIEEKDKEIERLNNIINKIKSIIYNSIEYNALTKVALISESLQGSDKE